MSASQLNTASSLKKVGHWMGSLTLRLAEKRGKTILAEKKQAGPYTLQRSFYPEGGICHLILLHPPGGLVEGDCLHLDASFEPNSHCVITTPSAGKVYSCEAVEAAQKQEFHIQDGAVLEWFPQETILFANSRSNLNTQVELNGSAKFAGWEVLCLGRPISNDNFEGGFLRQNIEFTQDGKPLLNERLLIDSINEVDEALSSDWGFAGFTSFGSLYISGTNAEHLKIAQKVIEELDQQAMQIRISVTCIDGLLVCRCLAVQSRHLKDAFMKVWSQLRYEILGVEINMPRIWNT